MVGNFIGGGGNGKVKSELGRNEEAKWITLRGGEVRLGCDTGEGVEECVKELREKGKKKSA